MDLNEVAKSVQAAGADLQQKGWMRRCEAPLSVAAYIAASEYIDQLSGDEIVDIVWQGFAVESMGALYAKKYKDLLKPLAREVILSKVKSDAAANRQQEDGRRGHGAESTSE